MTKRDIDDIIHIICPNDEDEEKPIISPAFLRKELEALMLEQAPERISKQGFLKAIDILHNEYECVGRDCDRDCANCELVKNEDEILEAIYIAVHLMENIKTVMLDYGYKNKSSKFYIGGRLFEIRELAQ